MVFILEAKKYFVIKEFIFFKLINFKFINLISFKYLAKFFKFLIIKEVKMKFIL